MSTRKQVTISQNGQSIVLPDAGSVLEEVDVTVAVPEPSGTIHITSNQTANVESYQYANVNVSASTPELNVGFGSSSTGKTGNGVWIDIPETNLPIATIGTYPDNATFNVNSLSPTNPIYTKCAGISTGQSLIVLFGGYKDDETLSDKIYHYDTRANSITESTYTLPKPLSDIACGTVNTFEDIFYVGPATYLFGGYDGESWNTAIYLYSMSAFGTSLSTLGVTLPSACRYKCVTIDNMMYLFASDSNTTSLTDVYSFDRTATSNNIKKLPTATSLNLTLFEYDCVAIGHDVFIFGGMDQDMGMNNSVYKYNIDTHRFTLVYTHPDSEILHCENTVAIDKCLYFFSGKDNYSIYKLDVYSDSPTYTSCGSSLVYMNQYTTLVNMSDRIYIISGSNNSPLYPSSADIALATLKWPDDGVKKCILKIGETYGKNMCQLFKSEVTDKLPITGAYKVDTSTHLAERVTGEYIVGSLSMWKSLE